MDRQAIFNAVVSHVAKQGGPSMDGTACAYRGESGRKCAIGPFIADAVYSPKLECKAADNPDVLDALPRGLCSETDLLIDLQNAHDRAASSPGVPGSYPLPMWINIHLPPSYAMTRQAAGDLIMSSPLVDGGIAARLLMVAGKYNLHPQVIRECFPGPY